MRRFPKASVSRIEAARLCTVAALTATVALSACHKEKSAANVPPPPVRVEAAQVSVGPVDHVLSTVGSLASPQDTIIAPQIAGKVIALNIRQGQFVKQGTVLVQLDDALERAALQSAEAAFVNAQQIYRRDRQVEQSGVVSTQTVESDLATMHQAAAAVDQAEVNLDYTRIRAPFSGALGLRQISLGAYLTPGQAIVDIQQMNPLYLNFTLPQGDVTKARDGQTVRLAVAGYDKTFDGMVTTVTQGLAVGSRSLTLQATVPNPKFELKPGMFATVDLVTGVEPKAILIPAQAVVPEGQINTVWTIGPNQNVQNRKVILGAYQGTMVQVLKGLKPGDIVVTAGVQKLHPGAKVVASHYEPITNPMLNLSSATSSAMPPSLAKGGNSAQ